MDAPSIVKETEISVSANGFNKILHELVNISTSDGRSSVFKKHLHHVVVGEITAVNTIFRNSGLQDVLVDCGNATYRTVSLAPNLKVGSKIAFAKLGALLTNTYVQIKEIGGVESHGKLCSANDLGLDDISDEVIEIPAQIEKGTQLSDLI